jgi:16S rRNA processing protein RimM
MTAVMAATMADERPVQDDRRLCLGVIAGAHGVAGLVRVKSFTAEPQDLGAYGTLSDADGARQFRLAVVGRAPGKRAPDVLLARIDGVADRDAAEALKGTRLYVARSVLPAPDEDEFYQADLIGLAAELADGSAFGTVTAVHDFGAGDVLEVARPQESSVLLPFTRAAVPVIDVAGGRCVVVPPEAEDD